MKARTVAAAGAVAVAAGVVVYVATKATVPPARQFTIGWDYPADRSNIVFRVHSLKTNQYARPTINWPVVSVTTALTYRATVDTSAGCQWFTVSASNTATRLCSGPAIR